ncbi:MAG: glycosyltransferase family 2 protein [Bacteroidetes bacterium]|nr:glycosyltransferase family 2 protein [Bacteroidota bacterium]
MYKGFKVGVVIPAYNEAGLIRLTLEGMPNFIDRMFVINDCSIDDTRDIIVEMQQADNRITLIDHEINKGLGQSLIDGYVASRESDIQITVIMAGDNQMDPNDLPALLDAIAEDEYDYVKGNRLLHKQIGSMPKYRFLGNSLLTILTKFATGYYFSMDPQCGYTAIDNRALKRIPIEEMTKRYGYNADILCMLNIQGFAVTDVEVRPVYDREKSKIKLYKYIPKTSWLLLKLFFKRLWHRYVVLDFHPLVLFFTFGIVTLFGIALPFFIRTLLYYNDTGEIPGITGAIFLFSGMFAFQSLLFSIWMDMDYNRRSNRRRR